MWNKEREKNEDLTAQKETRLHTTHLGSRRLLQQLLGRDLDLGGHLVLHPGHLRNFGLLGWRRALHLSSGSVLALLCSVLLVLASFMLKSASTQFVLANPAVGDERFTPAVHTLFHTTWMEVVILTLTLVLTRPQEFRLVSSHWRRMVMIGAVSFGGSLCWFWAYSLTLVAYSKAVGQIEAVLAVILALLVWREREVLRQLPGVGVVLLGIGLVLLG